MYLWALPYLSFTINATKTKCRENLMKPQRLNRVRLLPTPSIGIPKVELIPLSGSALRPESILAAKHEWVDLAQVIATAWNISDGKGNSDLPCYKDADAFISCFWKAYGVLLPQETPVFSWIFNSSAEDNSVIFPWVTGDMMEGELFNMTDGTAQILVMREWAEFVLGIIERIQVNSISVFRIPGATGASIKPFFFSFEETPGEVPKTKDCFPELKGHNTNVPIHTLPS